MDIIRKECLSQSEPSENGKRARRFPKGRGFEPWVTLRTCIPEYSVSRELFELEDGCSAASLPRLWLEETCEACRETSSMFFDNEHL
jgi:hypothetical protein